MGVVCVVFATVVHGMGVNLQEVNIIIHYEHHKVFMTTVKRVGVEVGLDVKQSLFCIWKPLIVHAQKIQNLCMSMK